MTGRMAVDDWQATARATQRKRRATWYWTFVAGGVGVVAVGAWVALPDLPFRWALLAIGAISAVVGTAIGTAVYMAAADEQERDANLWGCYVGMCVYLILYLFTTALAVTGTRVPPITHDIIFIATMATVLSVFAWKRFR